MKTLKTYLLASVLVLVSVTVFIACDEDDDTHTHEPVPVTSTPVEIIASNQASIDSPNGIWQDTIILDKTCLLTINARTSIRGISSNVAAMILTVKLDDQEVGTDGSSTTITSTLHASTSTTIFLQPGTYNLQVDRSVTGSGSVYDLSVNYHAIYAEMGD